MSLCLPRELSRLEAFEAKEGKKGQWSLRSGMATRPTKASAWWRRCYRRFTFLRLLRFPSVVIRLRHESINISKNGRAHSFVCRTKKPHSSPRTHATHCELGVCWAGLKEHEGKRRRDREWDVIDGIEEQNGRKENQISESVNISSSYARPRRDQSKNNNSSKARALPWFSHANQTSEVTAYVFFPRVRLSAPNDMRILLNRLKSLTFSFGTLTCSKMAYSSVHFILE